MEHTIILSGFKEQQINSHKKEKTEHYSHSFKKEKEKSAVLLPRRGSGESLRGGQQGSGEAETLGRPRPGW